MPSFFHESLSRSPLRKVAGPVALLALGVAGQTHAAEGFNIRHGWRADAGSLLFAEPAPGWQAGVAAADMDVRKVAGDTGEALTRQSATGVMPLPAPAPASLYPRYGSQTVVLQVGAKVRQYALTLGYVPEAHYAGGQMQWGLVLPYVTRDLQIGGAVATPTLQWPHPSLPNAATRAAVQQQFGQLYQARAASMLAAESTRAEGLGNAELGASWQRADGPWRVQAALGLVLPTASAALNSAELINAGKFYTLRPSVQAGYLFTPDLGVTGRLSAGLNTRNRDNDMRSGNWLGVDVGAAYRSPVGVWALQLARLEQVQDDSLNPWGAGRYRTTQAGLSYSAKLPVADATFNLQYLTTLQARNALKANTLQVRLAKQF